MDFSKILFRASSIGHLMSDPKLKADKEAGNLSETAKTNCIDIWVSAKYNRNEDVHTKYMEKGNMVEEDSITLYSRLKKAFYKKNETELHNAYFKGTPDLYLGKSVDNADIIIDIKSSWSLFTFHRVNSKSINPMYYYQLQTYMALTGAKKSHLAYCLIDTPVSLIEEEKRKMFYKMNVPTMENPLYLEACEEIEKNMIYDDIPMSERLIEFTIDRDDSVIEQMMKKVEKARKFLQEYENAFCPELFIAEHDKEVNATIIQITTH